MPLEVLYEDNHLLVVNKPADLPTLGSAPSQDSLVAQCKSYLKKKFRKPGNVYLGVVSRLDRVVSGIIVLARTSKAAARLNAQFRDRQVIKTYWALVDGPGRIERQAVLDDWLQHDDAAQRVIVWSASNGRERPHGVKHARLSYCWLGRFPLGDLLEIQLETGRKHQIRVQLSHRQLPIVGDRKYDSRRDFFRGIALHSQSLSFAHPVRSERITVQIDPPEYWQLPVDGLR